MKKMYLFPHRFKKVGLSLVIITILITLSGFIYQLDYDFLEIKIPALVSDGYFEKTQICKIISNNISNEIANIIILIGLIFMAFSKERNEDEFISKVRLESLVWATYFNYIIIVLAILLFYEFPFFWVLVCNMFTILIFFIIRFNWVIYKSKKNIIDEE